MNVLMMASSQGIGLTYHLTSLSIGLSKIGLNVVVVSSDKEQIPGLRERLREEDIPHYSFNSIDDFSIQAMWKSAKEISSVITSENIDVVHAQGISHLLKSYIASKLEHSKRKPALIVTLNSSDVYLSFWQRQILRVGGKLADIIIPLSKMSERELLHLGFPSDKLVLVPNAIDLQAFDSLVTQNSIEFDTLPFHGHKHKVIAYVAMLRPLKGHEYYLQAAQKVLSEFPETKFLVIGDGAIKDNLQRLALDLGIAENVIFTGLLPNIAIPPLLSRIDIGVSSSLAEQFPHSILELMAASKPIVATTVGAIPEMITDGENGFLVKPRDSAALAEGITKLLREPEKAKEMGVKSRKLVEDKFSMDVVTNRLEEVYRLAASKKVGS